MATQSPFNENKSFQPLDSSSGVLVSLSLEFLYVSVCHLRDVFMTVVS